LNLYCTHTHLLSHTLTHSITSLSLSGREENENREGEQGGGGGGGNTLNQSTINTLPDDIPGGEGEEIEIDPYLTHTYIHSDLTHTLISYTHSLILSLYHILIEREERREEIERGEIQRRLP
jgi:hypothetical protein